MPKKIISDECIDCMRKISEWFWMIWGVFSLLYMLRAARARDVESQRYNSIMGLLCGVLFALADKPGGKCACGCGSDCDCGCADGGECGCSDSECEV